MRGIQEVFRNLRTLLKIKCPHFSLKSTLGEQEIPGLTDTTVPRRLGPKRASKIRKLFNLTKNDDVRKYVIRRKLPEKEGKFISIIYNSCVSIKSVLVTVFKHPLPLHAIL